MELWKQREGILLITYTTMKPKLAFNIVTGFLSVFLSFCLSVCLSVYLSVWKSFSDLTLDITEKELTKFVC